jgi:uncharacterized secreted protein with C-terminal beta-propeller domain
MSPSPRRLAARRWGALLAGAAVTSLATVASVASTGCGGVYYAVTVTSASSRVEEARVLGAEQLAPYEYYYAREHLEQAQFEAAEASYSDAAHYAETAEEYAAKAVQIARAAKRSNASTE